MASPSAELGTELGTVITTLRDALVKHGKLHDAAVEAAGGAVEVKRGAARVVVLPEAAFAQEPAAVRDAIDAAAGVLLLGEPPAILLDVLLGDAPVAVLPSGVSSDALGLAVHGLLERLELRALAKSRDSQLVRARYERGELVEIAQAITRERDIDKLLSLILEKSRYVTGADAGSIYVIDGEADDAAAESDQERRRLHFKLSQNDSMVYESREFVMPVSMESIAGAAVVTKQNINVADVYAADADPSLPYGFDESFDERTGYRTVSMLCVPMISAEDEVIGVIQLINKKKSPRQKLKASEDFAEQVIPFDARSEELLSALAAQAGIALENALLYEEIREIFEGFVRASVQAIEQRDPTTSGHSQRVSQLCTGLAMMVDRIDSGPYKEAKFSRRDLRELEYAALLHDFGKIGVREQVLVKAKKLYPHEHREIRARIDFALKAAEADLLREKVELMEQGAGKSDLDAAQARFDTRKQHLMDAWAMIDRANEPTVLSEGDFSRIAEIGALGYIDLEGSSRTLLSDAEMISLKITRGSLSPSEINEIRSHVDHTYKFLTQIPWGKSMKRIPEIARAHHEKLNGQGYPLGVAAQDIPLPSKIMTIADIYDALTASDRPYKRALARDRALQILGFEVKDGNLDAELVRIFAEAEVHKMAETST
jgi:HD-GYP domain-containing protein (c-di-GMP phosphodiesterase class II)